MRMPRRDTQIFSLSMMDVISGAMGAFLIIMIVLMRNYKNDADVAAQTARVQEQLRQIQQQIAEARQVLMMTTDLDVDELIRRLEAAEQQLAVARREIDRLAADLQSARHRVSQLAAINDQLDAQNRALNGELQSARNRANQLQARNNELEQQNRKLEHEVAVRQPVIVTARWVAPTGVDIDLHLEDNLSTRGGKGLFDPRSKDAIVWGGDLKAERGVGFGGDMAWSANWVRRDLPPGVTIKAYLALRDTAYTGPPIQVFVEVQIDDREDLELTIALDASTRWVLAATLTTDEAGKTTARAATDVERRRDRAEVEARMNKPAPEGR